jgi:hypothetical protein
MASNTAQQDAPLVDAPPLVDNTQQNHVQVDQQQQENLHANGLDAPPLHADQDDDLDLDALLRDNAAFQAPQASQTIPADQLKAILDSALTQQKNDILSAVKEQLGSISSTPFSTIKRKADQFSNEGLKKQFVPLEEAKLRLDAVRTTMAGVAEGTSSSAIGRDEAAHAVKTLDEGISHLQKRMHFLEVAQVEGWNIAKCLEKNALFLDLLEDMQKQLKRAKKDAKLEEGDKKGKKGQNRKGFHCRRGGRGRAGFFPQSRGGFRGGVDSRSCYSCGQVGHISANCPTKVAARAHAGRQMM